jgi:hypothetical protein
LFLFGVLVSSSFGLYVRQNEWSDQFVQTISTLGVMFFLLHRRFGDVSTRHTMMAGQIELVLLFVSVNGVVTGHPGMWMIAGVVWGLTFVLLKYGSGFQRELGRWLKQNVVPLSLVAGSSAFSVAIVIIDLFKEQEKQTLAVSASQMWQGFEGDQLIRGATRGFLSDFLERMLSLVIASTALPLLKVLYHIFPSTPGTVLGELLIRGHGSFPRGEFTGLLAVLVALLAKRRIRIETVRNLLDRLLVLQALVWSYAILASLDVIPVALAPSAIFTIAPFLLGINVFIVFVVQGSIERSYRLVRSLTVGSQLTVVLWLILQLNLGSVNLGFPERHSTWFTEASELHKNEAFNAFFASQDRLIIVDARSDPPHDLPRSESFLHFVGLGIPVVAPANPKIRDTSELKGNIAFRNTLSVWENLDSWKQDDIDWVLDFLQVRYVAIELTGGNEQLLALLSATLKNDSESSIDVHVGDNMFRVLKRNRFSIFHYSGDKRTPERDCSVLEHPCPVIAESVRSATSREIKLSLCSSKDCIWRYSSTYVSRAERVILPIGYDEALQVRHDNGRQLETSNIGGFLGVGSKNSIDQGVLSVTLRPDARVLSRIAASYLNLGVLLLLLGHASYLWVQLRFGKLGGK